MVLSQSCDWLRKERVSGREGVIQGFWMLELGRMAGPHASSPLQNSAILSRHHFNQTICSQNIGQFSDTSICGLLCHDITEHWNTGMIRDVSYVKKCNPHAHIIVCFCFWSLWELFLQCPSYDTLACAAVLSCHPLRTHNRSSQHDCNSPWGTLIPLSIIIKTQISFHPLIVTFISAAWSFE